MSADSQENVSEPQTERLSESEPPRMRRTPVVFIPALASGGLLWLCHFPVNLSFLGWVALVPLLCLVRSPASARRIFLASWLCGLVFFVSVIQWMRLGDQSMYYCWLALSIYCSFYVPASIFLLRVLDRSARLPLTLSLPVVWVASEYLRGHLATGFPWYYLAHSQHDFLLLTQISDLGGAYGVTFLLAVVNALVYEWLSQVSRFRGFFSLPKPTRPLGAQTIAVLALLGSALSYGAWRLGTEEFTPGPMIALIQGNEDQEIRNDAVNSGDIAKRLFTSYCDQCTRAAAKQPALIIWPETSLPWSWEEKPPGVPEPITVEILRQRQRLWHAALLIGANSWIEQDDEPGDDSAAHKKHYNSAVHLSDDDANPYSGRYDKIHLVPFGEYVPLVKTFPWMKQFSPYDDFEYEVQSGEHFTRLPLGNYHFGVLICFEDTDPDLAPHYLRGSDGVGSDGTTTPPVDFLVNISNDGWFKGSSEHDEHLAISRFRAIECRRSIARAANMGISAIVDGSGRIVALPASTWESSKKLATEIIAPIPLDRRFSLYILWGDWLPATCGLILVFGLALSNVRPNRSAG